jgi:predicted Zn-dependent protease
VAGIGLGAWEIAQDLHFANVVILSSRLHNGEIIGDTLLDKYKGQAGEIAQRGICRSDLLEAGADIFLSHIDNMLYGADSSANELNTRETLQEAESYFAYAVDCNPTNGEFWAALAYTRQVLERDPGEVSAALRLSQQFSPYEDYVIKARLVIFERASSAQLESASDLAARDIEAIVLQENSYEAVRLLANVPQTLRSFVDKALALAPAARITELRKAGMRDI